MPRLRGIWLLTPDEIETLPDGDHADGHGLYLIVRNGGKARHWSFRFRSPEVRNPVTGKFKDREMGLGSARRTTQDVRAEAQAAYDMVQAGKDPLVAREKEKLAREDAVSARVNDALDDYFKNHIEHQKIAYRRETMRYLQMIRDALGTVPVSMVTRKLIMERTGLAQMWLERRTTAKKLGMHLNAMFGDAMVKHNLAYNPAAWKDIKRLLSTKLYRAESFMALRSYKDLPRFMALLRAHQSRRVVRGETHPTVALYVEMVVLTGVRQGEVRKAQWKEIDWENKNWHVPPENRKLKEIAPQKIRTVPISKPMLAILEEMQRRYPDHTADDLIFPSQGGRPFSSNRATIFANSLGWETYIQAHGFRNMLMSWGQANGKEQYLIERQFDHAVKGAVPKAYDATSRLESDDPTLEPRRKMMEEYAAFCVPPPKPADNIIEAQHRFAAQGK